MKFEEALKLMREGKKMADEWCNKRSYFFIYKGEFCHHYIDCDGAEQVEQGCSMLTSARIMKNDWHEYKDPILTDKEKAYLEAVLMPFKGEVDSIIRRKDCNFQLSEYICVFINVFRSMNFPDFEAGSMYKGMELGRAYTLKELGLFEEEKE